MESGSKIMTIHEGNTNSPCSALLERLKNLRRWQDEQRKEISLNQSRGAYEIKLPKENEFHQDPENSDIEALQLNSQGGMKNKVYDHGGNGSGGENTSLVEFQQSSNGSPHTHLGFTSENSNSVEDQSLCRDDRPNQEGLSCLNPSGNTSDSISTSPDLSVQEDYKKHLISADGQRKVVQTQDNQIFVNANIKKSIVSGFPIEREMYALKCNPSNGDDYKRKFQGLTNFISRHTVSNSAIDDTVLGYNSKISNETVSQPQPKFTYLKKGQGTARFGMKPLRFRRAKNSIQEQSEEREIFSGNPSANIKSMVTSQNCKLKVRNMPVKMLQLQDSKTSLGYEKCKEGTIMHEPAEKNEAVILTQSNIQQMRVTTTSENDKQLLKEQEELSAFEKLEELADDSSFSSNSSTVIRLLQRGLQSSSSTPLKSPSSTPSFSPTFHLLNKKMLVECCKRDDAIAKPSDEMEQADNCSDQSDHQQNQFPLVNVSIVLEQLKRLVRLEDLPLSGLSEEELRSVLESFIESENSFNVGSVSCFENNIKLTSSNPTSTPAVNDEPQLARPRVHFQPQGVQVLEYELSESDGENTLTDMASITDDTDLVTTSDLEVLTQIHVNATDIEGVQKFQSVKELHKNESVLSREIVNKTPDHVSNSGALQPIRLQFSPPCRPKNSASHYIWSIFGKEEPGKKAHHSKTLQHVSSKGGGSVLSSVPETVQEKDKKLLESSGSKIIEREESSPLASRIGNHEEVETHKALLMAKVCELEKEIDFYKKGNIKIKTLQDSLQNERSQFDHQKRSFQEEMGKEKVRFREYLDAERNKLWKEKQSVKNQNPSISSAREQSMEIVFLKEQLKDLQEELKKKDELHNAAVKKLNEKIRLQELELKSLKLKNASLQKSVQDNMQQKQKIDRGNVSKKPPINTKAVIPTGKSKMKTKTATINSINKSLDKVPVTVSEPLIDRQALMRDMPVQNKMSSLDRQSPSNSVHQKCNQEKNYTLQSFQQANKFESSCSTVTTGRNKNAQENSKSDNTDKRRDLIGLDEDKPENDGDEATENPVGTSDPGFLSSKFKPSKTSVMESSLQTQQSINIDSTELHLGDGTREIIYANGNKKSIHPDGTVIISYYNGDKKEIHQDRTVYVYGTDRTSHTTFINGKEILEFPNGQKETRFSDGSSEIIFPDKTRKTVLPDGTEVCTLPNGTIVHTNADGFKVMEFVSGQKEVHTPEQKRREYPDGTVKILHSDGRTETRYKTGRVRVKDREGNILSDTHQSVQ